MLLFTLTQAHAVLSQIVLQAGISRPRGFSQCNKSLSLPQKSVLIICGTFSNCAHQLSVTLRLSFTHLTLLFLLVDLNRQPFQAVTAVVSNAAFEFSHFDALCITLCFNTFDLGVLSCPFL